MTLPDYVEFGGSADSPAPFLTTGGHLRAFPLKASASKLDAIVRKTLNEPAGGAVEYRALGNTVILMLGGFDAVSCTLPPFDTWGTVREIVASFFVPVVSGELGPGGKFVATGFGLTGPYVIVDNPMSLVGGRDVYGYAKTQGRFTPPGAMGDVNNVKVYGGNFNTGAEAAWLDFMDVEALTPAVPPNPLEKMVDGLALMMHVMPGLAQELMDDKDIPKFTSLFPWDDYIDLAGSLLKSMANNEGSQVFLKQFRDGKDGTKACYQAVVEGPVKVTKLEVTPTNRQWKVTIHHLDSHPITKELGIKPNQTVDGVLEIETDFVVQPAVVKGP